MPYNLELRVNPIIITENNPNSIVRVCYFLTANHEYENIIINLSADEIQALQDGKAVITAGGSMGALEYPIVIRLVQG